MGITATTVITAIAVITAVMVITVIIDLLNFEATELNFWAER